MAGTYGYGRMMVNAGESYSCGVEASLRGNSFNNHLSWMLNYSYTRAVFKDYKDSIASPNGGYEMVNYKDKKVPFVPEHAFSAVADYRFDISNTGLRSIVIGANMNGQGKIYWDEENLVSQKLYFILGAHADANFGPFTVSVWGRNLTDTKYNTFAVSNAATGQKNYYAQQIDLFIQKALSLLTDDRCVEIHRFFGIEGEYTVIVETFESKVFGHSHLF